VALKYVYIGFLDSLPILSYCYKLALLIDLQPRWSGSEWDEDKVQVLERVSLFMSHLLAQSDYRELAPGLFSSNIMMHTNDCPQHEFLCFQQLENAEM